MLLFKPISKGWDVRQKDYLKVKRKIFATKEFLKKNQFCQLAQEKSEGTALPFRKLSQKEHLSTPLNEAKRSSLPHPKQEES